MEYVPPRRRGLLLGGLWLMLLLAAAGLGLVRLEQALITPLALLWISLPLFSLPLGLMVAYRMYGLATATYRLDRDGFSLRWGLAREQLPLPAIAGLEPIETQGLPLTPAPGLWWPGCLVGRRDPVGERPALEYFATRRGRGSLLLSTASGKCLVITPPDRQAFQQEFRQALRMGSLETIPQRSERPDFLINRLWSDRPARWLILLGGLGPLLLLGYLGARAPTLPSLVPFGFDLLGRPDPLAPPGRLLLLPLIGAACWLVDLAAGAWFYRRPEDRTVAYVLWGSALLTGGLFWGAALHLLA
jgi:hypothetical protein